MNKRKAQHKSGTQQYLLQEDMLKYWFVVVAVSIRGPEYCGKAKSLFARASMVLVENIDNCKWILDDETFFVISKGFHNLWKLQRDFLSFPKCIWDDKGMYTSIQLHF